MTDTDVKTNEGAQVEATMVQHSLFDALTLSFPESWTVDIMPASGGGKGEPIVNEADAFDAVAHARADITEEAKEHGQLNIKCYQIGVKSAEQQSQLLGSVFAEVEQQSLSESVFWALEELHGEEHGTVIAIKRWLVCSTEKTEEFKLVTYSYSVAAEALSSDAISSEITMLENAIKTADYS